MTKSIQELFSSPIGGEAPQPTIDQLIGETTKKLAPVPPINLPKVTVLLGDEQKCYDVAQALAAQSQMVYIEDVRGPVYDAVIALITNGGSFGNDLGDPAERARAMPDGPRIQDIVRALCGMEIPLGKSLCRRVAEINAVHDYNIVIRDGWVRESILPTLMNTFGNTNVLVLDLNNPSPVSDLPPMRMNFAPTMDVNDILGILRKTFP